MDKYKACWAVKGEKENTYNCDDVEKLIDLVFDNAVCTLKKIYLKNIWLQNNLTSKKLTPKIDVKKIYLKKFDLKKFTKKFT